VRYRSAERFSAYRAGLRPLVLLVVDGLPKLLALGIGGASGMNRFLDVLAPIEHDYPFGHPRPPFKVSEW
jgi:hypothetical protein